LRRPPIGCKRLCEATGLVHATVQICSPPSQPDREETLKLTLFVR
jgi:hypothetical protein